MPKDFPTRLTSSAGYDQLGERRFEFIPLWGFLVFLLYTMRRVDCRRCGVVTVEEVPWAGRQYQHSAPCRWGSGLVAATVIEFVEAMCNAYRDGNFVAQQRRRECATPSLVKVDGCTCKPFIM